MTLGTALVAWATGCTGSKDSRLPNPPGFRDECQFIVQFIVEDLMTMARYARHEPIGRVDSPPVRVVEKEGSARGHPVYRLHWSVGPEKAGTDLDLAVDRPIWEPSLYDPVVAKLFAAQPPVGQHSDMSTNTGPTLLARLSELNAETIEAANQTVSPGLAGDFLSPQRHAQAALVIGALALRESAGDFQDARGLLCRMTVHLALARGLSGRQSYSAEGQVAEAVLYTLMGNQKDALVMLTKIESGPEVGPWKRALRARITGDYRELEEVRDPTTLERVCWFEAYCRSVDPTAAWEKVPNQLLRNQPDFCRIANSQNYSVQLGHVLNSGSLRLEMAELAKTLALAQGKKGNSAPAMARLNVAPEPCVTPGTRGRPRVQVIGWGHWSMFLQRHLCHTVQQNYQFLRRKWGVPEAAAEFAKQADGAFGDLWLYPFVRRANATTDTAYRRAVAECGRLIRTAPHLVGPRLWNQMYQAPPGLTLHLPSDLRDISAWHRHNPPPFTAYQARSRLNHVSLMQQPDTVKRLEGLHERAPYDPQITAAMLHLKYGDYGAKAPFEVLEQAYAPVLGFSVPQMARVAMLLTNNPAGFERFMVRAAEQNGRYYFNLGTYFSERDDAKKAAEYYEKGVATCADAVLVSNQSRWLVGYYFGQGRLKEAEQLADQVADTYSQVGLKTKGDLLYWQGRYDESLAHYLKIEERYDQPGVIIDWWADYRGRTNDARYDGEMEKRLKILFPRGTETVTLASFQRPPDEGVRIEGESQHTAAAGLKKGDIIVALNGRRVYDLPQYLYVRAKAKDPSLRLIYWNGQSYADVTARPPNHRFGVAFRSYYARSR